MYYELFHKFPNYDTLKLGVSFKLTKIKSYVMLLSKEDMFMTYEDYNKIIEEIIASPSDDKLMLENFEKLRNAYKELDEKVKSAVEEIEALNKKYEDLRQTKVNEFFNREDKEEVAEEAVEEAQDVVEEKAEDEITVDDLFEDDIEVEVTEDDIIKEDEEKEEDE